MSASCVNIEVGSQGIRNDKNEYVITTVKRCIICDKDTVEVKVIKPEWDLC